MPETQTRLHIMGDEAQPRPHVVLLGVVLLGDAQTPEFAEVEQCLHSIVPAADVIRIRTLAELGERQRHGEPAGLVIIVQTWSDEFPFREFMVLPGVGPFTRVICCHGTWCVSDGRSRQDWPLATRVPLEHFQAALIREWQQLTNPSPADGSPIPWTAGRDEIFRARQRPIEKPLTSACRAPIRVVSADPVLAETWLELVRRSGMIQATDSAVESEIVLWDVDPWTDQIGQLWTEKLAGFPATRIVALTGFAGPDRIRELRALGAVAVISKLLPLNAMASEIERIR